MRDVLRRDRRRPRARAPRLQQGRRPGLAGEGPRQALRGECLGLGRDGREPRRSRRDRSASGCARATASSPCSYRSIGATCLPPRTARARCSTRRSATTACSSTWCLTPWARRASASGGCRRELRAARVSLRAPRRAAREVAVGIRGRGDRLLDRHARRRAARLRDRRAGPGAGARGYPPSAGTPDFREAAAAWMQRRFGVAARRE